MLGASQRAIGVAILASAAQHLAQPQARGGALGGQRVRVQLRQRLGQPPRRRAAIEAEDVDLGRRAQLAGVGAAALPLEPRFPARQQGCGRRQRRIAHDRGVGAVDRTAGIAARRVEGGVERQPLGVLVVGPVVGLDAFDRAQRGGGVAARHGERGAVAERRPLPRPAQPRQRRERGLGGRRVAALERERGQPPQREGVPARPMHEGAPRLHPGAVAGGGVERAPPRLELHRHRLRG